MREISSELLQVSRHCSKYFLWIGDGLLPLIGTLQRVFKVELNGTGEPRLGNHLEELGKIHHALPKRFPGGPPLSMTVFFPQKILDSDAAKIRTGYPQAVDPTSEAALNRSMSDIVIDTNWGRIESSKQQVEIPYWCTHEIDARMGVVHGA